MQFYVALVPLLWMDGTIKDQGRTLTTSPPPPPPPCQTQTSSIFGQNIPHQC